MTPEEIIKTAAIRRRRAIWLILFGLPVALTGFILAVVYETTLGQEQSGLFLLGGMVSAFLLFGAALHIYRCPACDKVPGRWTTSSHYRVWFSSTECERCGTSLR
jgi:hypothetical protein